MAFQYVTSTSKYFLHCSDATSLSILHLLLIILFHMLACSSSFYWKLFPFIHVLSKHQASVDTLQPNLFYTFCIKPKSKKVCLKVIQQSTINIQKSKTKLKKITDKLQEFFLCRVFAFLKSFDTSFGYALQRYFQIFTFEILFK